MRLALLTPGFSAHERDWCIPALLDYVRVLSEQADVQVFTLRWPPYSAIYPVFKATVHALYPGQRLGARVIGFWAEVVQAIAAEHRRAPFDVIHAFWADEPGWVATWAAQWLRLPLIISLAGGELIHLPDIDYGIRRLPGRAWLMAWALRNATTITAGSQYLLDLAHQQLPAACHPKLAYAPLGVDTRLFAPRPSAREPQASPHLLTVGSLTPIKDHLFLLEQLPSLPGVQWQVIGDGPLLAPLRERAAQLNLTERVTFSGAVEHHLLPAHYHATDLYIQTSRHEAQCLAACEAAACGLPIVGTPVGVLPELGLTASTPSELVALIRALLVDKPRRRALVEAGQKKIAANFELTATVGRWIDMYSALLKKHR